MANLYDHNYDVSVSPCSTKQYDQEADAIIQGDSPYNMPVDLIDVHNQVFGSTDDANSDLDANSQQIDQHVAEDLLNISSHHDDSILSENADTAFNNEVAKSPIGFDDLPYDVFFDPSKGTNYKTVSKFNQVDSSANIHTIHQISDSELLNDSESVRSEEAVEPSTEDILNSEIQKARAADFNKVMNLFDASPKTLILATQANSSLALKVRIMSTDPSFV